MPLLKPEQLKSIYQTSQAVMVLTPLSQPFLTVVRLPAVRGNVNSVDTFFAFDTDARNLASWLNITLLKESPAPRVQFGPPLLPQVMAAIHTWNHRLLMVDAVIDRTPK